MSRKTVRNRALITGALLAALVSCTSGPPVSIDNPPLGADGQSRWLFIKVVSQDAGFIGELYARKAGSASWGDDLVFTNNIGPGGSRAFDLDDGSGNCKFDLQRKVFNPSGPTDTQYQMDVDLCSMNKKKQVWLL